MKTPLPLLLVPIAVLAAPAPRAFEADVARPGTFQTSAYRGETLAIEAHLVSGRAPFHVPPSASASMLVSTNGVGWWPWPASVTTGGVIRATWLPEYDSYRVFLAVSESGTNVNYGANMLLRLLGSPGASPNELPLPTHVLDFSKISVTNAPWATYTAGDNITISNGVISATGGGGGTVAEETDPVFAEWVQTNALPHISEDDIETIVADATASVARYDEIGGLSANFALAATNYLRAGAWYQPDRVMVWGEDAYGDGEGTTALYFPTDTWGTFAVREDLAPYATRAWTLSTYGGTNAWMAVKGPLLGIYSCTNSAAGTNTLWESSSAMGGELAGVALRATNNTTRIAALERRPDITSWGDYAPDGTPNPDAEAMVSASAKSQWEKEAAFPSATKTSRTVWAPPMAMFVQTLPHTTVLVMARPSPAA